MSSVSFTRDEVILALDVLYFSGESPLNAQAAAMQDLSALLNRLPIHAHNDRYKDFRTPTWITHQILRFRSAMQAGKQSREVGIHFFEIDSEFADRRDELHRIAKAIRSNERFYGGAGFGSAAEAQDFPEGALLGHLHRVVEAREGARLTPGRRCEICRIDTTEIYADCPNLMQLHLAAPITALDGGKRYAGADFITVCPNCHAALHRRRPWLTKEEGGKLLR